MDATSTEFSQKPRRLVLPRVPAPYVGLIALHAMVAVVLGLVTGFEFEPHMASILSMLFGILAPWFVLIMVLRHTVHLAAVKRSATPTRDMIRGIRVFVTDPNWLIGGILRLVLAAFFVTASAYVKSLVVAVQPFAWDRTFAIWDRLVHFGQDPWRLLLPFFGTPEAVTALNAAYHAWFFLIYFATFAACFARPDDRKAVAFLIGLVLTFGIGGNFLAMVFSSAGPVYYERLGFGTDFAPLMAMLEQFHEVSPVWALGVQEGLWQGYVANGALSGISAMPSMHVATSVLIMLYAFSVSRWLGWLAAGFALSIQIGSVMLGWHYAVDGYFGALIAWAAWRVGWRLSVRSD